MKIADRNMWIVLVLLTLSSLALAQTEAAVPDTMAETQAVKRAQTYPLDYCIVTGEILGSMGAPVTKVYNGREVKFCCNACPKTFEQDKAKWTKKLDDAIIAAQKPTYPLNTCVVTGETLGSMGQPVDYVFGNRLARFCCSGCITTFNQNPGKYLAMIDAAAVNADSTEGSEGAGETPQH